MRDGSGRCPKHPKASWAKRPNATKRITGRPLQRLRAALFDADPCCAECKRQGHLTLATERDHIKPLQEGGKDDDTNVQGLCFDCHEVKSKAERARGVARSWAGYRERGDDGPTPAPGPAKGVGG